MSKDKDELISQRMRRRSPEMDPLRLGTGWRPEELSKPQIFIESTYGDSHPGSVHLNRLVEAARRGIADEGGFGARYYCTDMCDGESQGNDGINYSLVSREMIAGMIEIQERATPFDGAVYIASCDKGLPGNLMGMARVDVPGVVIPGGTMIAGPQLLTLEQLVAAFAAGLRVPPLFSMTDFDLAYGVVDALGKLAEIGLFVMVCEAGKALLLGLSRGWLNDENAALADRLALWARRMLVGDIVVMLVRCFLTLLLGARLTDMNMTVNLSIVDLVISLSALLLSRFVREGIRVRAENDRFI